MSEYINNSEERLRRLQEIILRLHQGADPGSVKAELTDVIGAASPGEVAAMEQTLLERGLSIAEIRSMCDLHHEVLDVASTAENVRVPPGHPVDVMLRENDALADLIARTRDELRSLVSRPPTAEAVERVRMALNELGDLEKHYARKENLFFSVLERHGVDGPSKVMWGKDDEVRAGYKAFTEALRDAGPDVDRLRRAVEEHGLPFLDQARGMVEKETNILLPMCLELFTEKEWAEVHADTPEYGWCLVEPRGAWEPAPATPGPEAIPPGGRQGVDLGSGVLSVRQLTELFRHLPVDVTFVDHEDRVRFFSETPERVFARSRTIIGRKVQHCHPPSSVDIVERILDDFRTGAQSQAAFWIELGDKLVHIRYFAVRGDGGQYLGCLEVTQDIAPLRQLQGERRLLQYD